MFRNVYVKLLDVLQSKGTLCAQSAVSIPFSTYFIFTTTNNSSQSHPKKRRKKKRKCERRYSSIKWHKSANYRLAALQKQTKHQIIYHTSNNLKTIQLIGPRKNAHTLLAFFLSLSHTHNSNWNRHIKCEMCTQHTKIHNNEEIYTESKK